MKRNVWSVLREFRVWFGISFILLNICMIISTWWWNTVCSCMLYCWTAWCWGSTIPFEKLLNSIAMNFVYQCFWYVTFHFASFLFPSLYPFTNGICTTLTSWWFVVALTRQPYFKSSVERPRENHPSKVYLCLGFYPLGSNR